MKGAARMRPYAFGAIGLVMFAALNGCGGDGVTLLPVTGKATIDGKPLTVGTVSFRPNTDKGNKSMHHPTGSIDAEGKYELLTGDKKGAPPGWYKVLVFADAHDLVKKENRPLTPQWLMHAKYISETTTDLSVEVVATPAAGAYDFKLAK